MSPAFCLEKNFKLKENLQGSPSGHHLLFTLKFQNHAKYRKIANICFLLPPTPPPHAPSQTSLSRRDTLPLGSSLAPRSEPPPPPAYLDGEPASLQPQGGPASPSACCDPCFAFLDRGPARTAHPVPPVLRDAEDTSHFATLSVPRRVQTARGQGPQPVPGILPRALKEGPVGLSARRSAARTPAERPAADSGGPSAARAGPSPWGA